MGKRRYAFLGLFCCCVCILAGGCGKEDMGFIPEVEDTSKYGTFDDMGNYITKRGILLTAEQYEEWNWCIGKWGIDDADRAELTTGGTGCTLFAREEYVIEGWEAIGKPMGKPERREENDRQITMQKAQEIASELLEADMYGYEVRRTCYDAQMDIWMVDFYQPLGGGENFEIRCVYLDGVGEVVKIYNPHYGEEVHSEEYEALQKEKKKKTPIGEDTFSFSDTVRMSGFVHDVEKDAELTKREIMEIARQEIAAGTHGDFADGTQVERLYFASGEGETLWRVSCYYPETPAKQIHVYISGKGQTRAMYVHEE